MFDRARQLTSPHEHRPGPVLHWMRREFRVNDNPALLLARELAERDRVPLAVVLCLDADEQYPSVRQRAFLVQGLEELHRGLEQRNIPLAVLHGDPVNELSGLVRRVKATTLTTDFDALRPGQRQIQALTALSGLALWVVDGRNIVPCWMASDKKEYMARTIRTRIHRLLPEFLLPLPELEPVPTAWDASLLPALPAPDQHRLQTWAGQGFAAAPVTWAEGGESHGLQRMRSFVQKGLRGYAQRRNDPVLDASSRLSPWLHFGFVSALRTALEAARSNAPQEDKDAFLEELIVRRELADNFCYYEPRYDSLDAAWDWAQKTLDAHRGDTRSAIYTPEQFETGETHQPLWNAAQLQLRGQGIIHGYMRMYWAKKILEWSESPEQAMEIAVRLNDCWALDGLESNGYAGVAWSIAGVHDRGWKTRPVYGNVRYMNANGARRKFDAAEYVRQHAGIAQARLFAGLK